MTDRSSSPTRVGAVPVILLMVALAFPGIFVSYMMGPDAYAGSGLPIGMLIGLVLVLLLVGGGLSVFFRRHGSERGNARAALLAVVAAVLFAGFVGVAAQRSTSGNAEATGVPSSAH